MSKGSKRRPKDIPDKDFDKEYDRLFPKYPKNPSPPSLRPYS